MRYGLELNTDIFETNIVNLSVVIAVVVTVVGERIGSVLDQRKEKIKTILQTIDKEVDAAKENWLKAKKALELAHLRSDTIHTISIDRIQKTDIAQHKQLQDELFLLRRKTEYSIKSERLLKLKTAAQEVLHRRLTKVGHSLWKTFDVTNDPTRDTKHQEVNRKFVSMNLNNAFKI
jgi:F-type H+-transporting ATPase subunit b